MSVLTYPDWKSPVDDDAIVILEVFPKKTGKTPIRVIKTCKLRLREYDHG
jgi:phage-related protein